MSNCVSVFDQASIYFITSCTISITLSFIGYVLTKKAEIAGNIATKSVYLGVITLPSLRKNNKTLTDEYEEIKKAFNEERDLNFWKKETKYDFTSTKSLLVAIDNKVSKAKSFIKDHLSYIDSYSIHKSKFPDNFDLIHECIKNHFSVIYYCTDALKLAKENYFQGYGYWEEIEDGKRTYKNKSYTQEEIDDKMFKLYDYVMKMNFFVAVRDPNTVLFGYGDGNIATDLSTLWDDIKSVKTIDEIKDFDNKYKQLTGWRREAI